jgi:Tol biopolymer transport system component
MRQDLRTSIAAVLTVMLVTAVVLTLVTPAHATFPGKNGRIAFGQFTGPNGGDIFTMSPDGSDVRQLTFFGSNGGSTGLGDWSPDGNELVFSQQASPSEPIQLWTMDADGSNQHLLLDDPSYNDSGASFSPDGSQIVFHRCPNNAAFFQCAIYRVNADGSKLTSITPINSNHDIIDLEPAYSQDGRTIAFESLWRDGLIEAIYLMNADGSGIRSLTPPALGAHGGNWSPDESNIVFSSNDGGPGAFVLSQEIWLISSDGHKTTRLTFTNNQWHGLDTAPRDLAPSWSPQGDAIVFERNSPDGSQSSIYVMNRDGSNQKLILKVPAHRAANLPMRNRIPGTRQTNSDMLKVIEQGGFFPRWGPAPKDAQHDRSVH